jgi:hypothetical protein
MYAEFWVGHAELKASAVRRLLNAKFREHDPEVIEGSQIFTEKWRELVLFATETTNYRMICFPDRNDQLQVVIEPLMGNIMPACQSAWQGIRAALAKQHPRLTSAKLIDNVSGKEFLSAMTGLGTELRRRDTVAHLLIGALTVVWIIIGVATFAKEVGLQFAGGAITGLIGASTSVLMAFAQARKGVLRWE